MITTKFHNCKLIRNGKIVKDDLWIRKGKIINPEPIFYEEKLLANFEVDCKGALIVPGFIDVQINGGYGHDFSSDVSNIKEAVAVVRKKIVSSGVTAFCPTIVTSPSDVYHKILPVIKKSPGGNIGAEVLGVHLEGPFISLLKKGAHPVDFIKKLDNGTNTLLKIYGDLESTIMVTLAPELNNADEVIEFLTNKGIVVSLGHSNGNLLDGERAVQKGASFVTHLFNAMLPFHHRDPGLVGLLTSEKIPKSIFFGIIADGIHTHPAALRIAHRTHPKGLVLVTDAMAALGLGEGSHLIGQLEVETQGRQAFLVGTETLAGSIAPMETCIRHFIKAASVSIIEGIESASLHPAQALGISDRKGTLDFESDADFVFLEGNDPEAVNVLHTFIDGKYIYSAPTAEKLIFKIRTK